MMGLSDGERISMIRSAVLIQYTRVTDRQTDRRNWRGIYALQLYDVARKNDWTNFHDTSNDSDLPAVPFESFGDKKTMFRYQKPPNSRRG